MDRWGTKHDELTYVLNKIQSLNKFVYLFRLHVYIYTGSSKKMDGIWNRYNLKSTKQSYTFGVLKCSENFIVLDLP